ncbi:MAG: type III pantothenate kinase [Rickettsiales bacterium]|nr:type III pantothenate kinase [Rickettsiales bacterium]
MLLAIDVGNTNTEFALFDGDVLRRTWRLRTERHRTADEYIIWLYQMFASAGLSLSDVTACIIASVVPEAVFPLRQLCKHDLSVPLMLLGEDVVDLGIRTATEGEVGVDRLVNAAEAWRRYAMPLVIVDFGTATTFDVVSDAGVYLGGAIAPGVNLSLEALQAAASKLPGIRIRKPESVIGRSTVPAMESGIFYGYLGLVDGINRRIVAEYGQPMKIIATGGLAALYSPHSDMIEETVEDLTIRGLLTIYRTNCT